MGWFDWLFLGGLALLVLCCVGVLVCIMLVDRHYSRLRATAADLPLPSMPPDAFRLCLVTTKELSDLALHSPFIHGVPAYIAFDTGGRCYVWPEPHRLAPTDLRP